MEELEKIKNNLKQCLEMVERAGADARFDYDRENYDSLNHQLDGAIYWSKKAKSNINKLKKELEKENQNDKWIIT